MRYRTLYFYRGYFNIFFETIGPKAQAKVLWTLKLLQELEVLPMQYFKHLEGTNGLYEIRVAQGNNAYRIFCFFDEGSMVVLTTGFQKKSRKTPRRELRRAIKIKEDYENEKNTNKS